MLECFETQQETLFVQESLSAHATQIWAREVVTSGTLKISTKVHFHFRIVVNSKWFLEIDPILSDILGFNRTYFLAGTYIADVPLNLNIFSYNVVVTCDLVNESYRFVLFSTIHLKCMMAF